MSEFFCAFFYAVSAAASGLRHTAATLMLQQGVHPKVVQERLGHAEISLTLKTYSHVLPSMQEEAAEAVESLITLIDISASKEAVRKGV